MAITVYICSNNGIPIEIPDYTETSIINNNQRLSLEEFDKIADELADLFMGFVGPDFQPLSDYAMSREGIYADHP